MFSEHTDGHSMHVGQGAIPDAPGFSSSFVQPMAIWQLESNGHPVQVREGAQYQCAQCAASVGRHDARLCQCAKLAAGLKQKKNGGNQKKRNDEAKRRNNVCGLFSDKPDRHNILDKLGFAAGRARGFQIGDVQQSNKWGMSSSPISVVHNFVPLEAPTTQTEHESPMSDFISVRRKTSSPFVPPHLLVENQSPYHVGRPRCLKRDPWGSIPI
jgi:hypothetical protein